MKEIPMSRLIAALLAALGLAWIPTTASAAKVLFKGSIGVEAMTSACSVLPYLEQGNLYKAAYMPADLGTNGSSASLMVMQDILVSSLKELLVTSFMTSDPFGPTYQPATTGTVTSTAVLSLNFEKYKTDLRLLEQEPANLSEDTNFVTMRLQIRNFGNVRGCSVTLNALLATTYGRS
jgi:hypothetical protein